MRKVAVLDLGTNTFHLLIAQVTQNGELELIDRRQLPVKLGEGGIKNDTICEQALNRAYSAIDEIGEAIESHNPSEIWTYATSVFRTTGNSQALIDHIESKLNTTVRIIDGAREAEFIFYGVKWAVELGNEPALILDIGGGSVEFIVANKDQIYYLESVEIGAARLIERFHRNDPITDEEIKALNQHFDSTLQNVLKEVKSYRPQILIGASGVFETLTEIELRNLHNREVDQLPASYKLDFENFDKITSKIVVSTQEELYNMRGMAAFRVNMIVVASLFTRHLIKKLDFKEIWFSDYAIKEGILYEKVVVEGY